MKISKPWLIYSFLISRGNESTLQLDPKCVNRNIDKMSKELNTLLSIMYRGLIRTSLKIEEEYENDIPDHIARTITENGRTIKLDSQSFRKE